jgi:rod shape determining protein RodA
VLHARRHFGSFDWVLLLAALALTLIGLVVIYSATAGTPSASAFERQLMWLALGLLALVVVLAIDYHTLAEFSYVFYGLAVALLILTLFAGRVVNASRSWIGVGALQFQPSEMAKIATILMAAAWLGREKVRGLGFVNFATLSAIVGVPVLFVLQQPDLGTAVTFMPLLAGSCFLAGIRLRTLIILALVVALALPIAWGHLKPYQQERVKIFLEPTRDPKGAGYQLIQSLIAVGSGGVAGKGFLSGTQGQLQFLPEQHTDFILAVLAEERGFLGSALVLALYFVVFYRCVATARSARDRLGSFLAMGVACVYGGQSLLNIGVVLGILPTTGVPLPLMSYGGSCLVSTLIGLGLVLNVWMRRLVN